MPPNWSLTLGWVSEGNRITGSARVGLLVVNDRFAVGGSVNLESGDFEGNALDAAITDDVGELTVTGDVELERVDVARFPPPLEPGAGGDGP